MKSAPYILGPLLFGGIALFLLSKAIPIIQGIEQMKDWTACEAELTSVYLYTNKDSDGDESYLTEVSYQYRFAEQLHTGDRISFGYVGSDGDVQHKVYNKLKHAKRIQIWVDPAQASESAIAQGWSPTAIMFLIFAYLLTMMFFVLIRSGLKPASWHSSGFHRQFVGGVMAFATFIFCWLLITNYKDIFVVQLEDKISVLEYMTDEEIERAAPLFERRGEGAFNRTWEGWDTLHLQLEKDTSLVK